MTSPVLLIGFDPSAVPGVDPAEVAPAFEQARREATAAGIEMVECLVAPDASAVEQVTEALGSRAWDCVVIGGGVRKPEAVLEFFELVINLVHLHAPDSAIAFNTSPRDSVHAALRSMGVWRELRR